MFSACWTGPAAALVLVLPAPAADPAAVWSGTIVRLEAHAPQEEPRISAAIAVAPDMLAAMLPAHPAPVAWRAAAEDGTTAVKLIARDALSGFCLLAPVDAAAKPWQPVALPEKPATPAPGAALEFPGSPGMAARCGGRDLLFRGQLQETPWLRVHLPPGAWAVGTPLTAGGEFAGLLAGPVPDVPDAARLFPARAVSHFVSLYASRHRFTRAFLGMRIDPATALPRVQECHANQPAERAGIQPGDVLLRMGTTDLTTAADVIEASFFLRVDDDVAVRVLRGTETLEVKLRPVPAPVAAIPEKADR